ncbi:MAG TPA: hypothetical protein VGQ86_07365 [Candidatus Limnocylindria bacterium]|jgi:uncharacterized membrane protein YvbJ|nr:hypothetical protein [Candidatus Limnocylindria bacterium]
MPGKKFGDDDKTDEDKCPKCGATLSDRDKEAKRCRNGHAL